MNSLAPFLRALTIQNQRTFVSVFRGKVINILKYKAQANRNSEVLQRTLTTMALTKPIKEQAFYTDSMQKLIDVFEKYQFELRIAGGAVRDLLMDIEPSDIDFATTATPGEMKDIFNKEQIRLINKKGESHGTITAKIDKEFFEVTTLRIDVRTDGRHAEVEWTRDWKLDALRRDLTINSLFLDFNGTVYDYFNGISDLQEKKVRFVGNAPDRIQEDYLRILRYFRFYGRIAIKPDCHEPSTLDAIKENMDGLTHISGERIWVELQKIVYGNHADHIIPLMLDIGLGPYIGIHGKYNVAEFQKVYWALIDLKPHHMVLFSALLDSKDKLWMLSDRVKLSKAECDISGFICTHRNMNISDQDPLWSFQFLYWTVGRICKIRKNLIIHLLMYLNRRDLLKTFEEWEPPTFPVQTDKLVKKGLKGKTLGFIINELQTMWIYSFYKLTEEELLDSVEDILNRK